MTHPAKAESFDFVVFGATGDLTMRKLIPAFYQRFRLGQIAPDVKIIGAARSPLSGEEYRSRADSALQEFVPAETFDKETAQKFLQLVDYVSVDAANAEADWSGLANKLETQDSERVRVFYVATAPRLYGPTADALATHKLISPSTRIVLEKPIGSDLASADALNDAVGKYFKEEQIFRIDHYTGKETVQNILALRFANPLLANAWSGSTIASVQITAAETVGVGKRGPYYDTAGALRDMVQNHLLQVLCVIAMEPPASLSADGLRDEKIKVLNALKPIGPDNIDRDTVRARYDAGEIDAKAVPGYLEDLAAASKDGEPSTESTTETFLAIRAEIDTPRWKDVPFYLRTGKRMAGKTSEVVIEFRAPDTSLFPEAPTPNRLVLHLQPNEGVSLQLAAKDAEQDSFDLRNSVLDVNYAKAFGVRYPDSYERLLLDSVRGDPILFTRRDEVDAAWRWIDPIIEGWSQNLRALDSYPAGSWGPESARALLAQDGFHWHEED